MGHWSETYLSAMLKGKINSSCLERMGEMYGRKG